MPTLDELLIQARGGRVEPNAPAVRQKTLDELLMEARSRQPAFTSAQENAGLPVPQAGGVMGPQTRPGMTLPDPAATFSQSVMSRIGPGMRTGQFAGGTLGALAVPALLGRLIPGPVDDALLFAAAVGGAGAGGAIGEATQQAVSPYEDIDFGKMGQAAFAEAVAETGGRLGGKAVGMVANKLVSRKAIQKFSEGILKTKIDPTDAGNRLYELVGRRVDTPTGLTQGGLHKELDAYFDPQFAAIAKQTAGGGIKSASLKGKAVDALVAHNAGEKILPAGAIKELEAVIAAPDVVTFGWLKGHKTYWQGVNAQLKRDAMVGDTALIDLAGEARRLQIDPSSWVNIDPKLAPQIAKLNRQYAHSEELMDSVFPRRWTEALKAKPEKAVDLIGNPSEKTSRGAWLQQIRNTKKALTTLPNGQSYAGGREAWDNLRAAWWTGQINKFSATGDFDTVGFEKMLNLFGRKASEELFDSGELKRVHELNRLLNRKNVRILNRGTLLGTVGVAGGVGAGLGWDVYHDVQNADYIGVARDGGIVMSAGILASAARSNKTASIVNVILSHPKATKEVMPATVRLVRLLQSDAYERNKRLANDVSRQVITGYEGPTFTIGGGI